MNSEDLTKAVRAVKIELGNVYTLSADLFVSIPTIGEVVTPQGTLLQNISLVQIPSLIQLLVEKIYYISKKKKLKFFLYEISNGIKRFKPHINANYEICNTPKRGYKISSVEVVVIKTEELKGE